MLPFFPSTCIELQKVAHFSFIFLQVSTYKAYDLRIANFVL